MSFAAMTDPDVTITSLDPVSFLIDWSKTNSKIPLQSETLIGRSTGFSGRGLSKRHCMIKFHHNKTYIVDMNSTNGTFVNGVRIQPGAWQPLADGDTLTLGELDFHFETSLNSQALPPRKLKRATETVAPAGAIDATEKLNQRLPAGFGLRALATAADGIVTSLAFLFLDSLILKALFLALFLVLPVILLGQTFGKRILGLRVVDRQGRKLDLRGVLFREAGMKLSVFFAVLGLASFLEVLGIAALAIFVWKTRKDGMFYWDKLCKTQVVSE